MTGSLPTRTPWFHLEVVEEGLVQITEPHAHELIAANFWWVRGRDRDLVVDTGLGVAPVRTELPHLFENSPIAVLTHTHLDHAGGAHEFDHVAVHESEVGNVDTPPPASLRTMVEMQHLGIVDISDVDVPGLLLAGVPCDGYDVDAYPVRAALVTNPLVDDQIIDLGDRSLRVVHLPGHTPGSIVLYEEARRALYSGDVIYDGGLLDEIHGSDIPQYVESMRRLLTLEVDVVFAGHDKIMAGERMREIARGYIARRS